MFLLLEERASVSNKQKTTRGSTHYRRIRVKEQETQGGEVVVEIVSGPIALKECAAS